MDTLVSIVIPNYNGALFLEDAVSSALEQDYPNKEIIVVDDGSSDNSVELLKAFSQEIVLIETKNRGASAARNAGILAARGEYVAFLDSDDIWQKNKLSIQMEIMVARNLDLVYCHGQDFGGKESQNQYHEAIFEGDCYQYFKEFPGRAIIVMGCSGAIIRKSRLERSGCFDEAFRGPAEDWDFFRRYCRDAKVGFCDQVLVRRRIHLNNLSNRSLTEYYLGNRRALLKMFTEDPQIGFLERRLIWVKFHFSSAKSFAKGRLYLDAVRSILRMCLPVTD
ncbi:MAG TPA: glycosyltransferase family A protein [Candidatus Paceibacterota bacterium]|nr:glycosyltransferase family A protein [Candidatus Paceibacterota bacterium]